VLLGRLAEREIILDPTKKIKFRSPIILGGGWKPGFSTDYDAVVIASRTGAKRILNLSNIDYVYDRDPKKSKRAKRIPHISWRNYRKIIPRRWTPGLSTPFDPVAARLAERLRLEVNILGGKSISNIRACLLGTSFKGTSIK
jgi:uridylate kinase